MVDSAIVVPATATAQSYCQVTGSMDTASTSVIQFRVILPPTWNNKFFMLGNGGFAGTLPALGPNDLQALARNYAIGMTNTGHVGGGNPTWALNNPLGLKNYGYRAVHLTALLSKDVINKFYGQHPTFSYFVACSNGGRQGLMEAQRYPADFDGIYAGAPALTITKLGLRLIDTQQAQYPDDSTFNPVVPLTKLSLLANTVLNKCDAPLDGIPDGIINDPSKCKFKVKKDLPKCPQNVDDLTCFTPAQLDVLEVIYSDMNVAKNQSYPKYIAGGEGASSPVDWKNYMYGMPSLITPANGTTAHPAGLPSRNLFLGEGSIDNYVTFDNHPQPINYLDFNLNSNRDVKDWLVVGPVLDADDPDLSAFKKHGGKLIMYHGWHDPILSPLSTIGFYQDILDKTRGKNNDQDFAKLYMMPGTHHCAFGPGAWSITDIMSPIENWVEHGVAPDSILATNPTTGLSRPLCPYPQVALLNNGLDPNNPTITNNAANFHCGKSKGDDDNK